MTSSPSRSFVVASAVPTTQGMPSSRETIAAWQVIPPESVTIAAERRISGTQSGAVMWVTRIVALAELLRVGELADDANVPAAGAGRGAEAADEDLAVVGRRPPAGAPPAEVTGRD